MASFVRLTRANKRSDCLDPPLSLLTSPLPSLFSHSNPEKQQHHQVLRVEKSFGTRKELAAIRTTTSHVSNMIKGVTKGFEYKVRLIFLVPPPPLFLRSFSFCPPPPPPRKKTHLFSSFNNKQKKP